MVHPILTLINKPSRLVIGFMSGTSADGIDAVLAEIHGHGTAARVKQRDFVFMPFEPEVRAEILRLAGGGAAAAADFCRMNFLLGELYCDAGRELCRHAGVRTEDIDLIGNHGQTFWHIPLEEKYLGHKLHGTLQLGEDAMLAEAFSCPVVGDFRVRDMAAGGLGAPLVPYTEFLLYRSETECVALQNIGGIGNISFLPAGCGLNDILAFDTGPGNMVMDALVSRITDGGLGYDDGGKLAASGHVIPELLAHMLEDPYLAKKPPKTTGREYYGKAYVDALLASGDYPLTDVLTTATRFTAESIAVELRRFAPRMPTRLVVGGGGSRNPTLLRFLQEALPECRVQIQEDLGYDSDAKEAVAFALLANEALFGVCNNAPSATGASHGVVMGRINL